jgi:hypothetical protein
MVDRRPIPRVPHPFEVFRALPKVGVGLMLPAVVMGAFGGSLLDLLLGNRGYLLAMAGVIVGPVAFGLAINALERSEDDAEARMAATMEAYRRTETERRRAAATARGDLVRLDEHRAGRRGQEK